LLKKELQVLVEQKAGWASEPVFAFLEKKLISHVCQDSIQDHSACSLATVLFQLLNLLKEVSSILILSFYFFFVYLCGFVS
jgi:hypothetical protein